VGQLVVAGGDATEVLKAIEGRLDPPTFAVAALVVADLPLAAVLAGDDRLGLMPFSRNSVRSQSAS
jgi:hypothetical protein